MPRCLSYTPLFIRPPVDINVERCCREIFGSDNVFDIGFLTHRGTSVVAYK